MVWDLNEKIRFSNIHIKMTREQGECREKNYLRCVNKRESDLFLLQERDQTERKEDRKRLGLDDIVPVYWYKLK